MLSKRSICTVRTTDYLLTEDIYKSIEQLGVWRPVNFCWVNSWIDINTFYGTIKYELRLC